jgi:hypothetical protein
MPREPFWVEILATTTPVEWICHSAVTDMKMLAYGAKIPPDLFTFFGGRRAGCRPRGVKRGKNMLAVALAGFFAPIGALALVHLHLTSIRIFSIDWDYHSKIYASLCQLILAVLLAVGGIVFGGAEAVTHDGGNVALGGAQQAGGAGGHA